MEEYKNCAWTELSDEQQEDVKTRLGARCAEQGLPNAQPYLVKALVGRIHDGTLNAESRGRFIKSQPVPRTTLLPHIKKVPVESAGKHRVEEE
jgi:hypothetical protein